MSKLRKRKFKEYFFRIIMLLVGLSLFSIGFEFFFLPNSLVFGGVSGLSIVVNSIYDIDPSIFVFVVSALLLIVSYLVLGKEKTACSVLGSLLLPLFFKLAEILASVINFQNDDLFLSSIFGGILAGVGIGIVYKVGFTTGGTDILNQILHKYVHISIGITERDLLMKFMIPKEMLLLLVEGV